MNKLETPDTVNPVSPPRGPINAVPPTVTSSMNRNDATIVPHFSHFITSFYINFILILH